MLGDMVCRPKSGNDKQLRGDGARQDGRCRVVPLAGTEAEHRLQQPLCNDLGFLVIAEQKAAALIG